MVLELKYFIFKKKKKKKKKRLNFDKLVSMARLYHFCLVFRIYKLTEQQYNQLTCKDAIDYIAAHPQAK